MDLLLDRATGFLEDALNLPADQLVTSEKGVAKGRDEVLVVIELGPDEDLLLLQELLHPLPRIAVTVRTGQIRSKTKACTSSKTSGSSIRRAASWLTSKKRR